jgi:hypothetical protein
MRRAWLPIVLIVILPAVAGFADETNTTGNVDPKVISELEEKALAHLQRQYPHVEVGRYKLINTIRLPSNTSEHGVVWFDYADRATVKHLAYRDRLAPKDGPVIGYCVFFKDHYTVRIRLDGVIVGVDEEHFNEKQFVPLCFPDSDGPALKLPKTLMGYWN